jgi:sporulation protein YlmC with PRC-barrel domain
MSEVRLQLLIGRRVLDADGKSIGRLEEVRAEPQGEDLVVAEYYVGSYAMIERLSAWRIGRAVLHAFGASRPGGGYCIPWDQLDLSDPERPRLICPLEELRTIEQLRHL